MPPSVGFLEFALTFGILAGIVWFLNGLWTYRRSRFVADTPQTPIRGIPMGLVDIRGKATGQQRVWSPVSHTPCYFYEVHFEQGHSGRGSSWSHLGMDANGVKFYLEDDTGKVAVDARLADFSMAKTCEREVSAGERASSVAETRSQVVYGGRIVDDSVSQPLPPATDEELRYYVSRRAGQVVLALAERALETKGSWRDPERMKHIMQQPLVGEGESPEKMAQFQAALLRMAMPPGSPGRDLLDKTMDGLGHPPGSPESAGDPQLAGEESPGGKASFQTTLLRSMLAGGQGADSLNRTMKGLEQPPGPEYPEDSQPPGAPAPDDPKAAQRLAVQAAFAKSLTHPELDFMPETHPFRMTEYCILPGQEYSVIGTCVENPAPQDEQDRNLIVKGKSEPTYVISDQGRVRPEDALRKRALRMVLEGGAIAAACLSVLLERLGLL